MDREDDSHSCILHMIYQYKNTVDGVSIIVDLSVTYSDLMDFAVQQCQDVGSAANINYDGNATVSFDTSLIADMAKSVLPAIASELEASRNFEKMLEAALNLEFEGQHLTNSTLDVDLEEHEADDAALPDIVKAELRRSKKFEQYLTACINSDVLIG